MACWQFQLTDQTSNTTFSASVDVGDLPTILGSENAFIGLTGGNGGVTSHQTVSAFSFISGIPLTLQYTETNTMVLSWPASALGYVLEQSVGLRPADWTPAPDAVAEVNGQNQVVITPSADRLCYRLRLH